MEKRRLYLILSSILAILIIFSAFFYPSKIKKEEYTGSLCVNDGDCIKTQTTCCPCNSGGQESCILKSELENYTSQLESCPERNICAQVYNCNQASCNCVKGKCIESLE